MTSLPVATAPAADRPPAAATGVDAGPGAGDTTTGPGGSTGPGSTPAVPVAGHRTEPRDRVILAALLGVLVVALAGLAWFHLGQGNADLDRLGVLRVLTGQGSTADAAVFWSSRLPRAAAGCLVGLALGAAGAVLQAVARNPLASPDTLGINAGAHLVLTVAAAVGLPLGIWSGTAAAFAGGLAAAALALLVSSGGTSVVRLVLAGSVLAMALSSITSLVMILNVERTTGMFGWGAGSLGQNSLEPVLRATPIVAVALVALVLGAHRLDLLQLGDDTARSLGLRVGVTKATMVALAVLLAAAAVSVAGPLGFVGLCAPALTRIARRWVVLLRFHRALVVVSALVAAVLVLLADVALRALFGSADAVEVPTGVITTALGAVFLVVLSQGMRTGRTDASPALVRAWRTGRNHPWLTVGAAVLLALGLAWAAMLLGDVKVLGGDVVNWLRGVASVRMEIILDARWPRVAGALVAGACLALAGTLTQAATRNPLADPGLLGVTSGAGAGAIIGLTVVPGASWSGLVVGALVGGVVAAALVFGLSARGGLDGVRLVLVGLGVSAGGAAATTLLVVRTDPYNQAKAITWLGGSTYGTDAARVLVALAVLVVSLVVVTGLRREADLLQLDPVTPRVLGVAVTRSRVVLLVVAVIATVAATVTVGVLAFVGLVAPHLARLLVGARHRAVVPLAVALGAALVVVADALGRTVIAPAQVPAGMVTALIGAPYFVWLMWKLRGDR